MEVVLILLKQIIVMFILVGVGYLMFRSRKITNEGAKTIANILIYLSLPCVIIKGFAVQRTPETTRELCVSAVLGLGAVVLSAVIARLCYRDDAIGAFAGAFSNPGFFGIPLIVACIGDHAVFYVAAFIACTNLGQWTHGVGLLTGKTGNISAKKILTAPFMIAIIIGLFFYVGGFAMPALLASSIGYVAGMNTPLAMFSVGIYLAQTDMLQMLRKPKLFAISAVRLIVIPAVTMLLLSAFPHSMINMKLAVLIAAACPVGSNIAVYAQLHNADYSYAVETVVVSTLLSLITMPLFMLIAQAVW